jgi:hypothetical protein
VLLLVGLNARVIHHRVDRPGKHGPQTSEERPAGLFRPCLIHHRRGRELASITLRHPLLDDYLGRVRGSRLPTSWLQGEEMTRV